MPRIYAPNEQHNYTPGEVDFINGAAAVPAGTNTSWFEAHHYSIDNSKYVLTQLDRMKPAELREICAWLGIAIDQGEDPDTKQALVRAIETSISEKYIASVTIVSSAGTEPGTSDIAITGAGTYKYKTGKTAAPALLYKDVPDSTWLDIKTGDDIEPMAADHDKITVVKLDTKGYVIGIGSDDLTLNTST
ncbi:MAG: hypothetical protein ACM3S4_04845 [Burkholderiales bacterium]